jgi:hypothetical protein
MSPKGSEQSGAMIRGGGFAEVWGKTWGKGGEKDWKQAGSSYLHYNLPT